MEVEFRNSLQVLMCTPITRFIKFIVEYDRNL